MKFPTVARKRSILRSEWANLADQKELEVSLRRALAGGDLELGLAKRGVCRRTWWGLGELLAGQVESVSAVLVSVDKAVGQGREMAPCRIFSSWRSLPLIPAPPAQALRLVRKSPSCIPQACFQTAASMLPLHRVVCRAVSLRTRIHFPLARKAHPESSPLISEVPCVKPCQF